MNTTLAAQQFEIFLTKFTGQNYIKRGWQKTGWAALIENDTASYRSSIQKVLTYGSTQIDADKNAESNAKSGIIPNVELLKCRILFDGGYYFKAQKILKNINSENLSLEENVEINYRYGRISQRINNISDAKKYYKQTIETGSSFLVYFAANSALLLGNIYEVEKDTIRASHYYNICLDLDFVQYRNSIRGKAKQGLKRVSGNL